MFCKYLVVFARICKIVIFEILKKVVKNLRKSTVFFEGRLQGRARQRREAKGATEECEGPRGGRAWQEGGENSVEVSMTYWSTSC